MHGPCQPDPARTNAGNRRIGPRVRPLGKRYAKVTTALVTLARLSAFDPADVLVEPGWTHYGIGVAQGPHPELGEHAIHVVLLLARSR